MRSTIRMNALVFAVAGAAAGGVIAATPAHGAPGAFVYTPKAPAASGASSTKPKQKTITDPKAGVCIKTPSGTKAKNYTLSAIDLFSDPNCATKSVTLRPTDGNGAPFEAIKAEAVK
ncbi:MAG TPA: hypothetical protein VGL04_05295 [Sporichthyaceae bacterium]